jgi:exodeoxyribonuclease III
MRIATWNVNSVAARLPRLLDWLARREPDVVALQETKVADEGFPYGPLADAGYSVMHVGEGRWNGVAVLARADLTPVSSRLADREEARYAAAQCGPLRVTSVYVPNGRALGDPHYAYKLDWLGDLRDAVTATGPEVPQVVMGDFNVALTDDDVWDATAFVGSTHVTPDERAALRALLDTGLSDVRARPGKNDRPFTYWDYRAGMFHKDMGMRIDYILTSRSVEVTDAYVDREARKGKLPSDHAPIVAEIVITR